jgi:adenosylmethionine---8-amino-7-oxononanoate aminotransferase
VRSSPDFSHIWMPFTHYQDFLENPPIVIERGEGVYLIDASGRRYLDAVGSWWVSIFGHNHPAITEAVHRQLDKLEHVMMAGFVSEPTLRLSHLLGQTVPAPLSHFFFSDDGSTAVEVALKIALQFHALRGQPRSEFVAFGHAYHGDTLGAMSVGNIPHYHSLFHERFHQCRFIDALGCYRCPAGRSPETCNAECLDPLEELLASEQDRIAACIFEPMVQGAAGMQVYPGRALKRLFGICKVHDVLTIDDEIAMGFGRTGKLFACEHADEVPDIMCMAKGLTGGYLPMAATAVTDRVFEEFKGDFRSGRILNHGHSFTGNPLAAAAACAALSLIKSSDIPSSLQGIMLRMSHGLRAFERYAWAGDVRTIGMVGAVEIVRDRATKEPFSAEKRIGYRIGRKALEKGVVLRPLGDVVYFMPPYIISQEQVDEMTAVALSAIREVVES